MSGGAGSGNEAAALFVFMFALVSRGQARESAAKACGTSANLSPVAGLDQGPNCSGAGMFAVNTTEDQGTKREVPREAEALRQGDSVQQEESSECMSFLDSCNPFMDESAIYQAVHESLIVTKHHPRPRCGLWWQTSPRGRSAARSLEDGGRASRPRSGKGRRCRVGEEMISVQRRSLERLTT